MYWLIGGLIITCMMGVLAVADSMAMPISAMVMAIAHTAILPLSLMTLAIILAMLTQLNIPAVNTKNAANARSRNAKPSFRIFNHGLIGIIAIGLIIGSALQALVSHQQAEATEITEPMRVQALVTIDGISDSVYDVATHSGYRQVATISHISPLVSELTTQDLDKMTIEDLENNQNSLSNNLSPNKHSEKNNRLNKSNSHSSTYRVLLNAYPKPSSKPSSKISSKNPSDNNPLASLNHLQPGAQVFMSLTLAPLATSEQATNNPTGFDSYRWLRGRHIDGVANILATSTSPLSSVHTSASAPAADSYLKRFRTRIDQGRWQLRQYFYQNWSAQTTAAQQAKAVTLSLLTGDRSLINRDTTDLYQLAGISHLLAISGTHVLFLAIVLAGSAAWLFDRLCPKVYRYVPRWQVRWWVMIGAAFIYALFTGFDVPAARTAWMLLAIGLVRLTLLPISTMRVLFALAVLMAWQDPYVLWQAGYWLSFIAVALLLKYDDTAYQSSYQSSPATVTNTAAAIDKTSAVNAVARHLWTISKRLFKLQFWLFITLLPITLLLFGKASLWGLVINLFAIGLFGWVIVPLNLLAGLCYLLSPALANSIWALVIAIVTGLHELIIWLTSSPVLAKAWLYTPVNTAILLMVLLSILPWLLPRGFVSRWLTLPPLTLLMMTIYANQQALGTTPTLYILPTGDRYVSAVLLQYPIRNNENAVTDNKNSSWLFLADHRPSSTRTMPSALTADKLATILEQQLGSLSIDKLEGIIIQSASVGLTATLTTDNKRTASQALTSELLPMTVVQLNQRLPLSQYWQAGRADRWPNLQQAHNVVSQAKSKSNISAQHCEQGKTWQLPTGDLSIQALTGWRKIDDASVWDCTVAIDTRVPLRVLKYNAAEPLKSAPITAQALMPRNQAPSPQAEESLARIILNADTHQRVWQMWSLLCLPEPLDEQTAYSEATWLGHSASHITADVINRQRIDEIMTYDDQALEVALSLKAVSDTGDIGNTPP